MNTRTIIFTTSRLGEERPLFKARKRLMTKGYHQLVVKWMGTFYRVKRTRNSEFMVCLDQPMKANKWAVLKRDSVSACFVIDETKLADTENELVLPEDGTDWAVVRIYKNE